MYTRRFRGDELVGARQYDELLTKLTRNAILQALVDVVADGVSE
ncbi:MAG: hypothetical protein U9R79_01400 [Armatimonadota bacterium]|nr:hypothetical protein [Armatimonadota bacterium]